MTQWYFADGNRHRQGPVSAEALADACRAGRINGRTLVWRDGLAEWRPLAEFIGELGLAGLDSPQQPPPLPPVAATVPAASPARSGGSGMSRGSIVALAVVGGLLFIAVPVIAIVAAIALPAYQDYTLRAKSASAIAALAALKPQVVEFQDSQGHCPDNDDAGFGAPESLASTMVSSVRVGRFDNGHCGLEAILDTPGQSRLDGKAIWLDYDPDEQSWTCSSEVDDRYLPQDCRG